VPCAARAGVDVGSGASRSPFDVRRAVDRNVAKYVADLKKWVFAAFKDECECLSFTWVCMHFKCVDLAKCGAPPVRLPCYWHMSTSF
jgi:hypothetical protein